jgi:urease accessory protein
MHPLSGWDHVLAMTAVGIWAAQQKGHAQWSIPVAFLTLMAVGGLGGIAGFALPVTEAAITLSIIVMGVLVVTRSRTDAVVGAAVVGLFAFFHGLAHGAEMLRNFSGVAYGFGFLSATAILHGVGYAISNLGLRLASAKQQKNPIQIP